MKCSICGYEFQTFEWEGKEPLKEQIARTQKKMRDHYVRDHRDIMIILSLVKETRARMDSEVYKKELEYVLKKKYNDETMAEIKKRARGLLYRIDFDLYVVINWIIDTIEDSFQSSEFKEDGDNRPMGEKANGTDK